jgi:hypothetical protein
MQTETKGKILAGCLLLAGGWLLWRYLLKEAILGKPKKIVQVGEKSPEGIFEVTDGSGGVFTVKLPCNRIYGSSSPGECFRRIYPGASLILKEGVWENKNGELVQMKG